MVQVQLRRQQQRQQRPAKMAKEDEIETYSVSTERSALRTSRRGSEREELQY